MKKVFFTIVIIATILVSNSKAIEIDKVGFSFASLHLNKYRLQGIEIKYDAVDGETHMNEYNPGVIVYFKEGKHGLRFKAFGYYNSIYKVSVGFGLDNLIESKDKKYGLCTNLIYGYEKVSNLKITPVPTLWYQFDNGLRVDSTFSFDLINDEYTFNMIFGFSYTF